MIENAQIEEITGTDKVNGVAYVDRVSGDEHRIDVQGIFVQIGTIPNTEWLGDRWNVIRKAKSLSIKTVKRAFQESLQLGTARIVFTSKLSSPWAQGQPSFGSLRLFDKELINKYNAHENGWCLATFICWSSKTRTLLSWVLSYLE